MNSHSNAPLNKFEELLNSGNIAEFLNLVRADKALLKISFYSSKHDMNINPVELAALESKNALLSQLLLIGGREGGVEFNKNLFSKLGLKDPLIVNSTKIKVIYKDNATNAVIPQPTVSLFDAIKQYDGMDLKPITDWIAYRPECVRYVDSNGLKPIYHAVLTGYDEPVEIIFKILQVLPEDVLVWCINNIKDQTRCVTMLAKLTQLDPTTTSNQTIRAAAIAAALLQSNKLAVEFLAQSKFDATYKESTVNNASLLQLTVSIMPELLPTLSSAGINIDELDTKGRTLLHSIVMSELDETLLPLLFAANINPSIRATVGKAKMTAFQIAKLANKIELSEAIAEYTQSKYVGEILGSHTIASQLKQLEDPLFRLQMQSTETQCQTIRARLCEIEQIERDLRKEKVELLSQLSILEGKEFQDKDSVAATMKTAGGSPLYSRHENKSDITPLSKDAVLAVMNREYSMTILACISELAESEQKLESQTVVNISPILNTAYTSLIGFEMIKNLGSHKKAVQELFRQYIVDIINNWKASPRKTILTAIHRKYCASLLSTIAKLAAMDDAVNMESLLTYSPALYDFYHNLKGDLQRLFREYVLQVIACWQLSGKGGFETFIADAKRKWGSVIVNICRAALDGAAYPNAKLLELIPDTLDEALKRSVLAMDLCLHMPESLLAEYPQYSSLNNQIRLYVEPALQPKAQTFSAQAPRATASSGTAPRTAAPRAAEPAKNRQGAYFQPHIPDVKNIERTIEDTRIYTRDLINNSRKSTNALTAAIANGKSIDVIKSIIKLNSSLVHLSDKDGNTPAHIACMIERDDIEQLIQLLDKCGADLDAKNSLGYTPLVICILSGEKSTQDFSIRVFEALKAAGVDIIASQTIPIISKKY